jgi:GTP-binding protein EngB required for normal cell division
MFKKNKIPRIIVGFMGASGCGKSTVLNVITGLDILPRSGLGEACTSVPVEVQYNLEDDPEKAFRAEITMVEAEDWRAELKTAIRHLTSDDGTADPNIEGAEAAAAKIRCVYPNLDIQLLNSDHVANLMGVREVNRYFGKTIEIEKRTAKEFALSIAPYIDGTSKVNQTNGNSSLWPMVKKVVLYVRSDVLRTGLVFVDLPGLGDSNQAREQVTDEYITEVSAICIVADIRRAITNAVAKNLHGRAATLKRQMRRSGLLDDEHTFFVLTMTDNITIDEITPKSEFVGSELTSQLTTRMNDRRARKSTILDSFEAINKEAARLQNQIDTWNKQIDTWNKQKEALEQTSRKRKEPGAGM